MGNALALILSGFLILPLLAFTVGQAVVGPYEGSAGLPGYLGSIFTDIWRGKPGAVTLVFAPTVIVAIWYAANHVTRRLLRPRVTGTGPDRAGRA